jgi:hypothetical protein
MAYQRLIDEAREHNVELDIINPPSPLRSKGKQQKKPTPTRPLSGNGGGERADIGRASGSQLTTPSSALGPRSNEPANEQ